MTEKTHQESGCTDYLQHNAESCPLAVTGESKVSRMTPELRNGDTIKIDGKRYVIAGLVNGCYTLLDASGPGWTPADFEE